MQKITMKFQSILLIIFKRLRLLFYKLLKKPRIYFDENHFLKIYDFNNLKKYTLLLRIYKKQTIINVDILKTIKLKFKS